MKTRMLTRQLNKFNLSQDLLPNEQKNWANFLEIVDQSYEEYETHLYRAQNTLNVATNEMQRLYKELEEKSFIQIQSLDSKLQNVMKMAPCFILWVDHKGSIIDCNDHFYNLIKKRIDFTKEKILCSDLKIFDLQKKLDGFIKNDLFQETFVIQIFEYYYKVTLNHLKDQNMISILGFDLTDDINKEKTLHEIQIKAAYASRMAVLGEIVAGVAHEINNPLMVLTSISYLLEIAFEQKEFDKISEKLEKIKLMTSRISRIVSSLRMYARDGEKDPLLPVDFEQIISESLELCLENLKSLKIDVSFEKLSPEPCIVSCRDTQISQVLLNLIGNARDALFFLDPDKPRWIKITLEKSIDDEFALLKVYDSGLGIKPEIHDKIFQPFFTTKEVGSGTGLGLSISSGIIKNHSGEIFHDNTSDSTCFVIKLPLSK